MSYKYYVLVSVIFFLIFIFLLIIQRNHGEVIFVLFCAAAASLTWSIHYIIKETGFNIITNFWSEATGLPRIWAASLPMRAVRKLPFNLCLFVKIHQRLKRKQKFKKIDNDDTPRVCYNNLRMVSDRRRSGVPALTEGTIGSAGGCR